MNNAIYVDLGFKGKNKIRFLIDTGASISTLKQRMVQKSEINDKEIIPISGLVGKTKTVGTIQGALDLTSATIDHKFHILPDDLLIPVEGIIGSDFLRDFDAIIDFEMFQLILSVSNFKVSLDLVDGNQTNFLEILPRCEKTYWIKSCLCDERVILPNTLCKDVFIAGSVCRPMEGNIPVRILNTRDEKVKIKFSEIQSYPADEFSILSFENSNNDRKSRLKKLESELRISHLNPEERCTISQICQKYNEVFHLDGDKLTVTNVSKAEIKLKPDTSPVYCKPYRLPQSQKQNLEKEVDKLLKDEIIEPCFSSWNAPILIVPKKVDPVTGIQKFRLVIDFRKLNSKVEDDKFPLPNISDILDMLGGAQYFSCLDLSQGYYQMELDENSRPCTAFSTDKGHYQLTRLPMGLKISPSIFSRMMSVAMSGLTYSRCFVYLDDLIVFGKTLEDHNKNLIDVFKRLIQVNLKLHPQKCNFLKKEIVYLGHLITDNGILPDPSKSEVVQKFPTPQDPDEVRRFVQFANYYRKFIPNFATIAAPLNKLLKKNVSFNFDETCMAAFDKLKSLLISPQILQFPNFENEFVLSTDASGYGIGAVLCNSDMRPVSYASRMLNKAEVNYSTIEKELLAVVWAVKHFRPYLFGNHFYIKTDHRPLIYLFSLKESSARLTKFRLLLEEYNFTIEYTPGKENSVADALSRIRVKSEDLTKLRICITTRAQSKKINNTKLTSETAQKLLNPLEESENSLELRLVRNIDDEYSNQNLDIFQGKNRLEAYVPEKKVVMIEWPKTYTDSGLSTYRDMLATDVKAICGPLKVKSVYFNKKELHFVKQKRLFNRWKKILTEILKPAGIKIQIIENIENVDDTATRKIIMNDYHALPTGGHAGINRMLRNIRKKYCWTGMQKDIAMFVKACEFCQKHKQINPKRQPMVITSTAEKCFEKIFVDLVGPLETSLEENRYILTVQDDLTKFVEAVPIKTKETDIVAKALVENVILKYGIPDQICSDQGKEFMSEIFTKICKLLKIKQLSSTAYHHETLGALENSHKILGSYLRIYANDKPQTWDEWLPFYVFTYNTSVHSETGYSPFELLYGRQCKLPSNIPIKLDTFYTYEDYLSELKHKLKVTHADAHETLEKGKRTRKEFYDRKYRVQEANFEPGTLVLVKNENRKKLDPVYKGPYEVVEDRGVNCSIKIKKKIVTIHKNRIKPFFAAN